MRPVAIAAAALAALAAAAALAFVGVQLLSLPAGGDGVARALAGGADQRHLAGALTLFDATVRARTTATDRALGLRARAEAALAAQRGDPALRSQARTLLGVLTYADAVAGGQRAAALLPQAESDFRAALRLDPGNEDAAADLELLLQRSSQQSRPSSSRRSGGKRHAKAGGRQHGRSHGATAATGEGDGY